MQLKKYLIDISTKVQDTLKTFGWFGYLEFQE